MMHRHCVPDEFEKVYVQQGRLACESYFRANRKLVDSWLRASGKQRLIDARSSFVAEQRSNGQWITRQTKLVEHREIKRPPARESVRDRRRISDALARHAAQYLRVVRNGGFIVSPASDGNWWVGSKRMSAAQMVDLAVKKGFEAPHLHCDLGDGVNR